MSSNIAQKLSILVHNQLPDYIADNNATYVAFLRAYYEYLEQNDSAHYSIQHARSYKDIDQTIDDFVDYFLKEYAYSIPLDIFSTTDDQTKRWFVKYASSLFKAKGSPNALKFLFRLAFGEEIDVIYPSDFLLRPSDGRFNRDVVIRTHIDDPAANLANLLYKTFSGAQSGVYSSVDGYTELSDTYVDLYLTDTDFYGTTFQLEPGESLIFDDTGNVTANITVLPVLTDISIVEPGLGYTLGDIITITPQGPGYFYGNVINMIRNSEGANAVAGVANAGVLPEYWANNTVEIRNFRSHSVRMDQHSATGGTSTPNVIIIPDGTNRGVSFVEDGSSGRHRINTQLNYREQGNTYIISLYAKPYDAGNTRNLFINAGSFACSQICFDVTTGNVLNIVQGSGGSYEVGNGWFRYWGIGTATSATGTDTIYIQIQSGITDASYAGDGVSGIYWTGLQLEDITGTNRVAPGRFVETGATGNIAYTFDYGSGIGLERTLANTTLINGVEGQRITYDGVAAEAGNIIITFDELLDIDIESTYTGSAYWQLISGSTANISSIYFGSGEFDISNSYIASNVSNVITQLNENLTRISHTFESMPTAENANLYLALEVQANTTINVTFDIGGIQFEEASANTSYKNPTSLYAYDSNQPTTITASIEKVGVAGDIVSVAVNQIGANISNATIITVSGGDDTREGSYTYDATANVATIKLSTKHGLEALDNVNLIVSTGNLVSNVYSVYESHTLQSFKVWFDDGTTNNSSGNLTLTYMKAANLQPVIGAISKQDSGYGIDVRGQLDTTIRLQNSEKWQDYSYVIRSTLDIDTWLELVKQTLHPAGMALFGELSIYSEIDADTESVYAGPEGPDNEGLAGGAWDTWTQLILLLTTDNAVKVEVTLPDESAHYTIEAESKIFEIESFIPIKMGASRHTVDQFKFEYGNAFPINTLANNTIEEYSGQFLRIRSPFQPPSYRESPNRNESNANIVLNLYVNS